MPGKNDVPQGLHQGQSLGLAFLAGKPAVGELVRSASFLLSCIWNETVKDPFLIYRPSCTVCAAYVGYCFLHKDNVSDNIMIYEATVAEEYLINYTDI